MSAPEDFPESSGGSDTSPDDLGQVRSDAKVCQKKVPGYRLGPTRLFTFLKFSREPQTDSFRVASVRMGPHLRVIFPPLFNHYLNNIGIFRNFVNLLRVNQPVEVQIDKEKIQVSIQNDRCNGDNVTARTSRRSKWLLSGFSRLQRDNQENSHAFSVRTTWQT